MKITQGCQSFVPVIYHTTQVNHSIHGSKSEIYHKNLVKQSSVINLMHLFTCEIKKITRLKKFQNNMSIKLS